MKGFLSSKLRYAAAILAVGVLSLNISAQNSLPAPGTGGGFRPSNGIGWNPGPGPVGPQTWGSPWSPGWGYGPAGVVNGGPGFGNFANQGTIKVLGCGYDAQGVWRIVPMLVSYQYNGIQYNVNVINAWDPWTDMWNTDIDAQAFNTNYFLRGVTYNFYVVLSYGTFYFNL